MARASGILLVLGLGGIAFYYWGIYTLAGRRRFDEMAGMIPFFVGVAGGVFVLVALVLYWRSRA